MSRNTIIGIVVVVVIIILAWLLFAGGDETAEVVAPTEEVEVEPAN